MKPAFLYLFVIGLFSVFIAAAQTDKALAEGNEYYRQSQFDLAERQYRLALEQNANNTTAQLNLANALYKQKKYAEAVAILQKANGTLQNKAVKGDAHYNEGVIYSAQKELEKSIEAYKEALRNNPTDVQARENLQKALLELKKQQQEKQSQQAQQKPTKMSAKEAQRQLEQLQKKEEELQQRLQKRGQGGAMQKDW